jgi:hypothetical protein
MGRRKPVFESLCLTFCFLAVSVPNLSFGTMNGQQCGYHPILKARALDIGFSAGPAVWDESTSSTTGQASELASLGSTFIGNLQRGISDELGAEFKSIPEYSGHSVVVTGPMKFRFVGEGNANQTIAGLLLQKIQLTANFSKTKHFLFFRTTVRCQVDVSVNKPAFTGKYFLNSGRMDLSLARMTSSQSQSCSSSLGWVPWLGNKIASSAESKIAGKAESVLARLTDKLAYSFAARGFSAISASIPLGRVVHNGVDFGLLFRQQLPVIVANQKTELDLYARSSLPLAVGTTTETLFAWRAPSSQIELQVNERKLVDLEWRGSSYCREP